MAFDLSTAKPVGFDLSTAKPVEPPRESASAVESGIQAFGEGASFGFLDELQAGVETGIQKAFGAPGTQKTFSENLADKRAELSQVKADNPGVSQAAGVAGSLASGIGIGGAAVKGAQTIGQGIVRSGASGAGFGAAGGAGFSEGETAADVGQDAIEGALIGGTIGTAFPAVVAATGSGVKALTQIGQTDVYQSAVKRLRDSGVRLSFGQLAGKEGAKRLERTLGDVALVGRPLKKAMQEAHSGFQKALLKEAGVESSNGLVTKRVLDAGFKKVGAEYQKALAGKRIDFLEDAFITQVDDVAKRLEDAIDLGQPGMTDRLLKFAVNTLDKNKGVLTGQQYQELRSKLGTQAFKFQKQASTGNSVSAGDMADLLTGFRQALDEAVERQFPGIGLAEINKKYANLSSLKSVLDSRNSAEAAEGMLPPSALWKEAKKGRNSEAFKELAEAGSTVLPDRTPNSGTASRMIEAVLFGGSALAGVSGNLSLDDAVKLGLGVGVLTGGMQASRRAVLANPKAGITGPAAAAVVSGSN